MRVLNRTPFPFAPYPGRLTFPGHTLTLIVKGTFDLSHGGIATPAEEQEHVTGDVFYDEDPEMQGSCRYESDFAYYKPRADLLLAGTCHAPLRRPVPSCLVTFQVGDRAGRLLVSGNRHWRGPPGLRSISEPEPFTHMELRYENSFGGNGFGPNPVGKGYGSEESEWGEKAWALPNVEDPDDLVQTPRSRTRPAGFGPLGRFWEERGSKVGTYKGGWARERWPWLAEDFDFSHFNAAPLPMQFDGYLRGDEGLFFENLHPRRPRYETRLPGIAVRCFLHDLPAGQEETRFREVPLGLDTLWADMDAEKVVLVWRGWTGVESEDFEEVEHVFILAESLEEVPASLEECHQAFLATLAEAEAEMEAAPEAPEKEPLAEPEAEEGESVAPEPEPPAARDDLRKQVNARVDALLAQAGIRVEELPPEAREAAQRERNRILDVVTETDPERAMDRHRNTLRSQMTEALSRVGLDLENLPPVSQAAAREQARLLRELGGPEAVRALQDPDMATFFSVMAALLPKAGVDPEDLTPLIAEAKKHKAKMDLGGGGAGSEEEEPEAEEPRPPWTRESVAEAAAEGESFAGEDLSGLDLSGLDLAGLDLSHAKLMGSTLAGSKLGGAILAGTDLTGADLSGADLGGANLAGAELAEARLAKATLDTADLTGAKLPKAVLTGASLADALFVEAEMPGALLDGVRAPGDYFLAADLSGARLSKSDFPGADFSGSVMKGADFRGSDLTDASIEGAACIEATFDEADLTRLRASEGTDFSGSSFVKAWGPESIWGKANLNGTDFSFARMEGASFMGATLKDANLHAADLKHARFLKADLSGARLVEMNLFEGSLERANLTDADLRGSNLYGVEFYGAVLEGIRLEGTNLRMTKLEKA